MYKTITLGGTEQEVKLAGQNCDIRNDGAETVYISAKPNITAGADGVLSVPVGQAAKLLDCRGTVYLLGTGIVLLCGNDYAELVFKAAATSSGEGGTQDDVARNMASANAASISQMKPITDSVSNANLLINPDFKINQRGQTEYTQRNAYTVDGWKLHASVGNVFNPETKTLTIPQNDTSAWYGIVQSVEHDLAGKTVTMSAEVETDVDIYARITYGNSTNADFTQLIPAGHNGIVTLTATIPDTATGDASGRCGVQITNRNRATAGGQCKIEWVKLEYSSVATPFTPPDPATELAKCQRFYQVRTSGDIDPTDLRPSMAEITDIVQREDGKYAYIAAI